MDNKQWLTRLVAFDTTSSKSNLELIHVVAKWLKENKAQYEIIPAQESKANLLITIPASNKNSQGGLILSGHTDVVPIIGQTWTFNPFTATSHDDKIYGRGTADMKGFIAVLLALIPELTTLKLRKPIYLALTCDEEIGCLGAPFLLQHLKQANIIPEACIVGEPSSMQPIIGYKGRQVYHCQVQGLATHASLTPQGCNAIEYATRIINYINTLAEDVKIHGPFDNDFDVPFTTITTNIVSGGQASNVIPATCEFIFEMRYLPKFPTETIRGKIETFINEKVLPDMRKSAAVANIYLDLISEAPSFNAREDAKITHLLRTITGFNKRLKVSYSTEAGLYQAANIPTIICGPGSIAQAHGVDEFISLEQLNLCENIVRNVIHLFCG